MGSQEHDELSTLAAQLRLRLDELGDGRSLRSVAESHLDAFARRFDALGADGLAEDTRRVRAVLEGSASPMLDGLHSHFSIRARRGERSRS